MFRRQPANKLTAYFLALDFMLADLFFIQTVNWVVVNYYLRFVAVLLALAVAFWMVRQTRYDPWLPARGARSIGLFIAALALLPGLGYVDARVLRADSYPNFDGEPLLALYPLQNGMHVLVNGGNGIDAWGMNDAYQDWLGRPNGGDRGEAYGVDIVKIGTNGKMVKGVLPEDYRIYNTFNEFAYSPCMGMVVYLEDGIPNVNAFEDSGSRLGNRAVIQCADTDYFVTISNLSPNTFFVKKGDFIYIKSMIARVGNSASFSFPHLHMHVSQGGYAGAGTVRSHV